MGRRGRVVPDAATRREGCGLWDSVERYPAARRRTALGTHNVYYGKYNNQHLRRHLVNQCSRGVFSGTAPCLPGNFCGSANWPRVVPHRPGAGRVLALERNAIFYDELALKAINLLQGVGYIPAGFDILIQKIRRSGIGRNLHKQSLHLVPPIQIYW